MKWRIILYLFFAPAYLNAQELKDYIVRLNKDTLFVKALRMDKRMKHVICEEKGKRTKYEAKDVLELKYDTMCYEVGFVRLKRFKQHVFLKRTIKGKLNLYEIDVKTKKVLWKNVVEDFIRLAWAYRAQKWVKKNYVPVYFYKKENESREQMSKSWKEKAGDCKMLEDKTKSENCLPTPKELVRFYNLNCK